MKKINKMIKNQYSDAKQNYTIKKKTTTHKTGIN